MRFLIISIKSVKVILRCESLHKLGRSPSLLIVYVKAEN